MANSKWDLILRCQTWHVWPETFSGGLKGIPVNYGVDSPLLVDVVLDAYLQRTNPAIFVVEGTDRGPELPNDLLVGLHGVGGTFLKTPEDVVPFVPPRRHARRGELDIILDFEFDGDPLPPALIDALRDTAFEVMALLNVHLRDFLTPALPFQIRKLTGDGNADVKFVRTIAVQDRRELAVDALRQPLTDVASVLLGPTNTEKFRTALELYAAHFNERQVRVRFLLLVIAMEALAVASPKEQVALDLVDRWIADLSDEKKKHDKGSSAYRTLESLGGQVNRLKEKSIGAQIADLFDGLPGVDEDGTKDLKRRVKDVYNARSTLVHEGYLPAVQLRDLEQEAKTLAEVLFRAAIRRSEPPEGLRSEVSGPDA